LTTQPQLESLIDIEEQYQVATYKKFPFVIERGQDVWVYTTDGERYLDLYGGHASVSTVRSGLRVVGGIRTSLILLVEPDRRMVDDGLRSHRPSESVECGLD